MAEPYAHSLSSVFDATEFERQLKLHADKIEILFGKRPSSIFNAELIYSDEIGEIVSKMGFKTVWAIFQPHTFSRTFMLLDDFAKALSIADKVVLADIYAARETDTLGISSNDLCQKLVKKGTQALYIPSFDEIETFLKKNCVNGDLLITMGAGDVLKIGENLLGI